MKIYAPQENFGVFGASLPGTFYRRDESLPRRAGAVHDTCYERPRARWGGPASGAWTNAVAAGSARKAKVLELREIALV